VSGLIEVGNFILGFIIGVISGVTTGALLSAIENDTKHKK